MGTITKRELKKSGNFAFQATIRIAGQKSIIRTFTDRAKAEYFIAQMEPKLKTEASTAKKALSELRTVMPTLANYLREELRDTLVLFCDSSKCSNSDKKCIPGPLAHVGHVRIGQLDAEWVEAYIAQMIETKTSRGTGFSYATLTCHFGAIARACRWRAKQMKVTPWTLPFSKRDNFPKGWENKRSRRLSRLEEAQIRGHFSSLNRPLSEQWGLLLDLALETGARLQEMILAEHSEFDVEDRVWSMPAHHTKKTTERFVILTFKAQAAVKRLIELRDPASPRLFHLIPHASTASHTFYAAIRKLGIKDLRFHDLRHEAISRMITDHRDVRVFEVMQMVGHKSADMLHRYSHGRANEIALRMK